MHEAIFSLGNLVLHAELRPFESIYRHFAAGWVQPPDMAFHEAALRELVRD